MSHAATKYLVTGKKLGLRCEPSVDSERVEVYLGTGETFEVSEEVAGSDGRIYLKLSDGLGWVYDRSAKDLNKIVVQKVCSIASAVAVLSIPSAACNGPASESSNSSSGSSSDSSSDSNSSESSSRNSSSLDSDAQWQGGGVSKKWVGQEWGKLKKLHGLVGWTLVFDKAKRRKGCCKYKKKRISISEHYLTCCSEKAMKNTLLHEIAHALVGKDEKHGAVWKAKAIAIGCDGRRCSKAKITGLVAPFELRCKRGCWSVGKYRQGTLTAKHRCKKCKGPLEYLHDGKVCKAKEPLYKYELRCLKGCWTAPRQRRVKKETYEKKRCKRCCSGLEFRRVKRKLVG